MAGCIPVLDPEKSTAPRRTRGVLAVACAAVLAMTAGCRNGIGAAALRPLDEGVDISGIMGPNERRLHAAAWEERRERLKASGVPIEGLEEYEAAQRLYDAGEYRAAETAFKTLAKQRSRAGKSWQDRILEVFSRDKPKPGGPLGGYGDPIEEDALFMVAECQFAQRKYSWAQDSYTALLEKYPSTRHLDDVTRRLFFIAQTWLGVPPAKGEQTDVELVQHSDSGAPEPSMDLKYGIDDWPVVPNLVDRSRPVFDTHGRAIQALEAIWRHDATGPLADDALMLQATYYHRKGDFIEAARLYKLVRDQYPESPHFQDAFLLGSHVTLASYDGPEYEGGTLEEARRLKETSRRLFANLSEEQKQRLDHELEIIHKEEIEREWARVEFYRKKNQLQSVALYCNRILNRYPDTEHARRAMQMLEEIRPKMDPETAALFLPETPPARITLDDSDPFQDLGRRGQAQPDPGEPSRDEWWQQPYSPRPIGEQPQLRPVEPESPAPISGDDPPARIQL